MVKKIFGGLFFIAAVLVIAGGIFGGTLFSDKGSAVANYGYLFGVVLIVAAYVLSGLFLFLFDGPTKCSYAKGFKKRSKQCTIIIVFTVFYIVMMIFSTLATAMTYPDNYILSYISAVLPFLIPMLIFLTLTLMCAQPHWASRKYFLNNEMAINEYLGAGEVFYSYSDDNTLLAGSKALFFPKLFCLVPFNQIASIKLTKQLWEQDVYFNLHNGKKFYVVTKHYESIAGLVNYYAQFAQK